MYFGPPPWRTRVRRSRSSATSCCIRSRLVLKIESAGLTCESRTSIHQPQQSVLNPQVGQRQTACIRYISAPQRSHNILSVSPAGVTLRDESGRAGGRGGVSDMPPIMSQVERRSKRTVVANENSPIEGTGGQTGGHGQRGALD